MITNPVHCFSHVSTDHYVAVVINYKYCIVNKAKSRNQASRKAWDHPKVLMANMVIVVVV